jgi:hypothetical protein
MRDFDVLARKAASQHGLLTNDQLRACGFERRRVDRLIRNGLLRRVRPRVCAVAGAPIGWAQDLCAAVLSVGGLTLASHRAGLRLWGLRTIDDQLEIILPDHRRIRPSGVVVHHSVDLRAEDRTVIDAIPVTSVPRTLVDAGLVLPASEVQRLVGQALVAKLVTRDELWSIRRRVSEHGRTGVIALERALESLPDLDRAESGPELELAGILESADLPVPVAQYVVRVAGQTYRLDFAYPDARLAIEYDGFDHHITPEALAHDRRRQNQLLLAGWFVLRFTWKDIRDHPTKVITEVRRALRSHDL